MKTIRQNREQSQRALTCSLVFVLAPVDNFLLLVDSYPFACLNYIYEVVSADRKFMKRSCGNHSYKNKNQNLRQKSRYRVYANQGIYSWFFVF